MRQGGTGSPNELPISPLALPKLNRAARRRAMKSTLSANTRRQLKTALARSAVAVVGKPHIERSQMPAEIEWADALKLIGSMTVELNMANARANNLQAALIQERQAAAQMKEELDALKNDSGPEEPKPIRATRRR